MDAYADTQTDAHTHYQTQHKEPDTGPQIKEQAFWGLRQTQVERDKMGQCEQSRAWLGTAKVHNQTGWCRSVWPLVSGWYPRDELRGAEGLPEATDELGPSVRDDLHAEAMEPENMLDHEFRSLLGGGELGQVNKAENRSTTRTRAIWDQGLQGTDGGRRPLGHSLEFLDWAHCTQAATDSVMSCLMVCYQNQWYNSAMLRVTPG